jgi:hypothetical protein
MKEKPAETAKITAGSDIQSVFYNSDYIGLVYKDGDSENSHYTLNVYDKNGKRKFSESIDFDYDKIYGTDDEIIITGGTSCKIIRKNGSVKFDGDMDKKIISMVPSGRELEYVVVYSNSTDVIRLKSEPASLKTTDDVTEPNTATDIYPATSTDSN